VQTGSPISPGDRSQRASGVSRFSYDPSSQFIIPVSGGAAKSPNSRSGRSSAVYSSRDESSHSAVGSVVHSAYSSRRTTNARLSVVSLGGYEIDAALSDADSPHSSESSSGSDLSLSIKMPWLSDELLVAQQQQEDLRRTLAEVESIAHRREQRRSARASMLSALGLDARQ
jgi:hypothetical protein